MSLTIQSGDIENNARRSRHASRSRRARWQVPAGGRIEVVGDFVAAVFERRQRSRLREVVQMPDLCPSIHHRVAQHRRDRQLQWYVENAVLGLRPDGPGETDVIVDVLDDVDAQRAVISGARIIHVAQPELDSVGLSRAAKFDRLRRNLVAREASGRHGERQLAQDFTGATAHFADGRRFERIAREDASHLLRLPGGVLDVPGRVLVEIASVGVDE